MLILFENQIPKVDPEKNKVKIIKIVTEYLENGKKNIHEYASKISLLYDKHSSMEYKYKISLNKIAEIEDLHEHNELTYFALKDIVS